MDYRTSAVPEHVLPDPTTLALSRSAVRTSIPTRGIGAIGVQAHIRDDLCPGLSNSSRSSRYYGFVTGGATPVAQAADYVVTEYDQNVQVHLPNETIATDIEHHALNMLCQLVDLEPNDWTHKTFTTGATASSIVGLASGREYVVAQAGKRIGKHASVAEHGLAKAVRVAELDNVQVLTTVPHSSILKAASVIGLGHDSVVDVAKQDDPRVFDLDKLERAISKPRVATIINVSCAEVNTGLYATDGLAAIEALRRLADQHGAWIHVDAAFGFMSRVLPDNEEFAQVRKGTIGLELADSITGDGHKLLNVPYDTGFFLSRHLDVGTHVFQNPNAAYLSSGAAGIPSPLNVDIQNSRRFRALPVYANLVAYGREGYSDMIVRQVRLARRIARFLMASEVYQLLPRQGARKQDDVLADVFIIVIFRARDDQLNQSLVAKINATRRIYCSGTKFEGQPAARFAISNWKCDPERDWAVTQEVLEQVAQSGNDGV